MVRAKAKKLDDICLLIYPNEKEVVFNVTLHAALEDAVKLVRVIFKWDATICLQLSNNIAQCIHFSCIMLVAFQVLLELAGQLDGYRLATHSSKCSML